MATHEAARENRAAENTNTEEWFSEFFTTTNVDLGKSANSQRQLHANV